MSPRVPRMPMRILLAACAALLAIGAASVQRAVDIAAPQARASTVSDHAGMHHSIDDEMTEEEMQAFVDAWFAEHPRVGAFAVGTPTITFRAFSLNFDYDSNPTGTPIDSVVIGVGDIVAWQRLIGAHTITSGVDNDDSEAGVLFDQPLDAANPVFQFQYDTPGRFPFFCRVHADFYMQGVVTVVGATPTEKTSFGGLKAQSR